MGMFDGQDIEKDARAVLDTVADGGVAIFPVSVGYAIVGHTEEAVARIYEAKQRSFGKPCGVFSDWQIFNEVIQVDERAREVVRTVIDEHDLPFSIVAPYDPGHPVVRSMAEFVLENASLAGTMDLLMNAGALHDAVARGVRERGMAVVGSSANQSLTGSKFRLEHIEDRVRAAADLCIDYGLCTYRNDHGLGSTIVDLVSFETIRKGCVYDEIGGILMDRFDIDLKAIGMAEVRP
ncbi:MAG: Sua5/YciO/YrdC/YwlC family protein [Pseudomonadota bacterium]